MRLLLVEKRASNTAALIRSDRDAVERADSVDEALSILRHTDFDVVVVDMTSLSEAGFAFIRRLRSAKDDTPVIALTAFAADQRTRALRLGADDAVASPCNGDELIARISAVARRHKGYSQSKIDNGDLRLCLDSREVRYRDAPVSLTAREYQLLELLALRKGAVVTKEAFLSHLYNGSDESEAKIVDVFICKLRLKLKRVGAEGFIVTVWGRGYTMPAMTKSMFNLPRAAGQQILIPVAVASGTVQRLGIMPL